jgi:hypothetical protein
MRDSWDFINFFKQVIYHEVEETYHDFLEDIKMLRENHIMIKGHEKASGNNFIRLGKKFLPKLEKLEAV